MSASMTPIRSCDGKPGQWLHCDFCTRQEDEGERATCAHPDSLANGGPGLVVTFRTSNAIACSRGRGGHRCQMVEVRMFLRCSGFVPRFGCERVGTPAEVTT